VKKLLALIAAMTGTAVASELPYIVGSIKNRANGSIQFTSSKSDCTDSMRFAFIRGDGGKIEDNGCYLFADQFIIVVWRNGETYTYSYEGLTFTQEMQDFARKTQ
jgi:hypothetical protein